MDIDKIIRELTKLRFFFGLNELEINKVIKYTTLHEIRTGKVLFYQGDQAEMAYFVISGKIKKIKYRADESSAVIGKSGKGEWIGLSELLLNGPCLFDAVLEEKSDLLCINSNKLQLLMQIPGFTNAVTNFQAREYYQIHGELECRSPYEKIVNYFAAWIKSFEKKDKKTGNFMIDITQESLAETVGFTRETVNKHLHELQDKGIISIGRGRIEIIKPEKLE